MRLRNDAISLVQMAVFSLATSLLLALVFAPLAAAEPASIALVITNQQYRLDACRKLCRGQVRPCQRLGRMWTNEGMTIASRSSWRMAGWCVWEQASARMF
jgi:hypothetical protein